ncbi:ABC transporter permease [Paenibacillus sp. LMG 31460]|uniref:Transport permease protein n=1 Tax=Paenibacillus germinis TaxID=2654979 RepID=A0ABX1Z3X6_9BACL|nr:ABC transporter permease [Paenibacillus germinis]NOU87933.1 ABC transporter permease [Paenibacillus germinis]
MNLLIKEDVIRTIRLILNLSKTDFWSKYSGSIFGIFWGFFQPFMTVLVYWFVFQIGFKVTPLNDVPFSLWLVFGLIPWFFFSEAFLGATNSFIDYSYLVKKVIFRISILPVIKVFSSFYIHFFFLFIMILLYFFYGLEFNLYNLQIIYYVISLIILVSSISIITSTIVVFFRDLSQIVSIFLQFSIWLTPIMWSENVVPDKFKLLFKLNPIYYIINGYRESFFSEIWFWQRPYQTIYFWMFILLSSSVGIWIFKKMKKHFSDVL